MPHWHPKCCHQHRAPRAVVAVVRPSARLPAACPNTLLPLIVASLDIVQAAPASISTSPAVAISPLFSCWILPVATMPMSPLVLLMAAVSRTSCRRAQKHVAIGRGDHAVHVDPIHFRSHGVIRRVARLQIDRPCATCHQIRVQIDIVRRTDGDMAAATEHGRVNHHITRHRIQQHVTRATGHDPANRVRRITRALFDHQVHRQQMGWSQHQLDWTVDRRPQVR